jgi:hypothetical protein
MPRIFALLFCFLFAAGLSGCGPSNLSPTPVDSKQIQSTDLHLVATGAAAADGITTNQLTFTGGPSVTASYDSVTLSISPVGLFSNGAAQISVPLDVNGAVTVYVTSRTPSIATVVATVGGVSAQTPTTFTIAWPSQMLVQSDSAFLDSLPGTWATVTATLLRVPGEVNSGESVSFTDSSAVYGAIPAGSNVGTFLNTTPSDTSGLVTTQYWLQNTNFHGYVYIIGTVNTPTGPVVGRGLIKIR